MISNTNRYALVTGGSSGMGLEYVRQLAQKGYNVIIAALFQNETDVVKEEMDKKYPDLDFVSIGIDLSKSDSAKDLYDKVKELRPDAEIEVLINNAGVLNALHFKNMTEAQISRIIMIHNHTTTLLCHYYLGPMLERKKGYILNVSSLAAMLPYSIISTYAATKAYTRTFTKALRMECHGTGVNVCTIYFGAVDTNLYKLSSHWKKVAHAVGVMISAEYAAKKALNMMFHGRSGRMPGFINRFFYVIKPLFANNFLSWIDRSATKKWNLK